MAQQLEHAIKFKDSNIFIEVDQPVDSDSIQFISNPIGGTMIREASGTFENAMENIRPAAQAAIAAFRDLEPGISDVEVEFGIKFGAEANVYIAKGSGEGNFKVKVVWKRA